MNNSNNNLCYLCQSPAYSIDPSPSPLGLAHTLKCEGCGDYSISDRAASHIIRDNSVRYKLSAVLCERKIKGLPSVFIALEKSRPDLVTIDELVKMYPLDATEMIERSLINISKLTSHPCDEVNLNKQVCVPVLFSKDITGAVRMVDLLESLNYIKSERTGVSLRFVITAKGWEKIAEMKSTNIDSKQVFVAMWFDSKMDKYFAEGIKPAIENSGDYRVLRIDQSEHNNKICDQIIAEIKQSRFMVADFTGNRGGVYFEAGFALGLGLSVIWTVEKEFLDQEGVHFDTRQYNHLVYETPEELRDRLKNRIRATIV